MSEIVVDCENLSKRYRLGARKPYGRLSETIWAAAKARLGRRVQPGAAEERHFWALDDLSFRIRRGEIVGVIGRNGAGKSTLLKILSRVTEPTAGRATIVGRVGSLLEVGTGFHPELSGRENVFLNGAILGMSRGEILRRFDEIIAFAEVEKFLDLPVKRYSSGMYLRLAFSVAAHLEADLLLVDEVLAVGDAVFQKKCLGKMGNLSGGGRTVVFVSHQLNAVKTLCSRALWLSEGRLRADADPQSVIGSYLAGDGAEGEWVSGEASTLDSPFFSPRRFLVEDSSGRPPADAFGANRPITFRIEGDVETPSPALTIGFALSTAAGEVLFWSVQTDEVPARWPSLELGRNALCTSLPAHFLNEGDYVAELIVSLHYREWISEPGVNAPAVRFSIRGDLSESPHWISARPGHLAPILRYERGEPTVG